MENDIVCSLQWGDVKQNPRLVIEFSSNIHPDNVLQLCGVLEKTATKWINCKVCVQEECEKKYN